MKVDDLIRLYGVTHCYCLDCHSRFYCPTDSGGACRCCGSLNWIENLDGID
jgi:hypothetical protein